MSQSPITWHYKTMSNVEGFLVSMQVSEHMTTLLGHSRRGIIRFKCKWCDDIAQWTGEIPEGWLMDDSPSQFPLYDQIAKATTALLRDQNGVCPKISVNAYYVGQAP